MWKLVVALLFASCAAGPPPPVVESRCQCEVQESCHRKKWQTLLDVAVESTAQQGVACTIGCPIAPITPKQAKAIVDWYCAREAAKPRSEAMWFGIDDSERGSDEFWRDAQTSPYDLRMGSWVSASKDREEFSWELRDQSRVATKITLNTILGGGDSGPMPFWVHFYFDARDQIFGVNLGAGSACPFIVTSFDGAAFVEHGEILRDLRAPWREATQDLATAGPATCTRAMIRVLERKPETTYLDSLALEIDGITVAPAACPGAAYCADDGVYHVLERDQSIDVAFDVPHGADCRTTRVIANGYYVPSR